MKGPLISKCVYQVHFPEVLSLIQTKFSKFKTSFVFEIREVSDTLMLNADVSRYTCVIKCPDTLSRFVDVLIGVEINFFPP